MIGRSFENLSYYQAVRYHKDGDSEEYARTYYEALNQTLLTQNSLGSSPNTFSGAHLGGRGGSRGCGPLHYFDTIQILPSTS